MSVYSPTGLQGARSPIYISLDYSALASLVYQMQLELYIWTGARGSRPASPNYTLQRSVFTSDLKAAFNVSPYIRESLSTIADKVYTQSVDSAAVGEVVWVSIDWQVDYISKLMVSTVDSGTLDTFYATDGYALFEEGINNTGVEGFTSPNTTMIVSDADSTNLSVNLGVYQEGLDIFQGFLARVAADGGVCEGTCSNIGWNSIQYVTSTGDTYTEVVDLSGTSAADRIRLVPSGVVNTGNWLNANSYANDFPEDVDWYELRLLDGLGNTIDSRRFKYECSGKYTPVQLAYTNKLGTWSYMTFHRASQEELTVQSDMYRRNMGSVGSSGFSYNTYDRQYQQYNKRGKKKLTLNTGWVAEGNKEAIEELLLSENVLILSERRSVATGSGETYRLVQEVDDALITELEGFINLEGVQFDGLYTITQIPYGVNVLTDNVVLQKSVNDKTINYTLEVEFANDHNILS